MVIPARLLDVPRELVGMELVMALKRQQIVVPIVAFTRRTMAFVMFAKRIVATVGVVGMVLAVQGKKMQQFVPLIVAAEKEKVKEKVKEKEMDEDDEEDDVFRDFRFDLLYKIRGSNGSNGSNSSNSSNNNIVNINYVIKFLTTIHNRNTKMFNAYTKHFNDGDM